MKLIASNPIVHGDVANYKAMVYKMILPSDISQPPTIELYQRGVTVSQYTPNFGNGIPADFYTDLHTVQINWEIEGGYDTCFFGVIYHRGWLLDSPVVFTDMHYNTRTGSGSRELVLYRADGVIDDENNPKPYPDTHVMVNHNSEIYSDTRPWDLTLNHVHVIEEQPIDTFLKIRVICGHTFTYTSMGVQLIESKQVFKFFVPDNYEGSGDGGGCGCGGGTVDMYPILDILDKLDAIALQVTAVDTNVTSTSQTVGAKVDLVIAQVDAVKDVSDTQFNGVHSHISSMQSSMNGLFDNVNSRFTNTNQVVQDQASAVMASTGSQISGVMSAIEGVHGHMSSDQNELKTLLAGIEGVPSNVIDMIMDIHAEAMGSWSWDKRAGTLTMFDTHGLEAAVFSITDTPDVSSRERRTDLESS